MDNRVVFLTADKSGQGQAFSKPRVISVMEETITEVIPASPSSVNPKRTMVKVKGAGNQGAGTPGANHLVFESPQEVEAARNPASTDIFLKAKVKAGLSAAGNSSQGSATALVGYINELTTVTTGSADSVKLPAATVGKVVVIINNGAGIAQVYPATGETIDGAAANAAGTPIASGTRQTLACRVLGAWITADDYTQA